MAEPLLVTVTDAAAILACGRTMLYQLIARGEIQTIKLGRATRIPLADLREYVRSRSEQAA